jgi:hypothetical protein
MIERRFRSPISTSVIIFTNAAAVCLLLFFRFSKHWAI